jgi:hypothetical protein
MWYLINEPSQLITLIAFLRDATARHANQEMAGKMLQLRMNSQLPLAMHNEKGHQWNSSSGDPHVTHCVARVTVLLQARVLAK